MDSLENGGNVGKDFQEAKKRHLDSGEEEEGDSHTGDCLDHGYIIPSAGVIVKGANR